MYVCIVITDSKSKDQPGEVSQSCSWSAAQGKLIFYCPRTCLRIRSRETGSAVLSRVSLLILHTQAGSSAYSRDSSRVPRQRPFNYIKPPYAIGSVPSFSSQSRVYCVSPEFIGSVPSLSCKFRVYRATQMRTDSVRCRESAGTRPVNLKVIPNECCLDRGHHGPINIYLSFPHPLLV